MKKLLLLLMAVAVIVPASAQDQEEEIRRLRDKINKLEARNEKLNDQLKNTQSNVGSWMNSTEDVISIIDKKILEANKAQQELDQRLREQIVKASGAAAFRSNAIAEAVNSNFLYLVIGLLAAALLSTIYFLVQQRKLSRSNEYLTAYTNETADSLHGDLREKIDSRNEKLRLELGSDVRRTSDKLKSEFAGEIRRVESKMLEEHQKLDEKLMMILDDRIRQFREEKVEFIVNAGKPVGGKA